MEIDHESDRQIGEPQIRQRLGKMDRQYGVNRLHFYDDSTLHEQIEAIRTIQPDLGGFEQAWPQQAMNFDSGRNDVAREIAERNGGKHIELSASDRPCGSSAIFEVTVLEE